MAPRLQKNPRTGVLNRKPFRLNTTEHFDEKLVGRPQDSGFYIDRVGDAYGGQCAYQSLDQDTIKYFLRVAQQLKEGFTDQESRDIFFDNVLEQIKEKEIDLSCDKMVSFCMQSLLDACDNGQMLALFLRAFASDFRFICTHQNASHVMQALLRGVIKMLAVAQLGEKAKHSHDKSPETTTELLSGMLDFGYFCLQFVDEFLQDPNSCHVLRSMLQFLGGHMVSGTVTDGRSSQKRKWQSDEQDGAPAIAVAKPDAITFVVPEEFSILLKKFAKYIWKHEGLEGWSLDQKTCPFIQMLLLILHEKEPKYCQRMVKVLVKRLLICGDELDIPALLTDKTGSRLTEVILRVADAKRHAKMWNICFRGHLVQLALHPIGNFVVQKLFKVIENKEQFQIMCEGICPHLESVMTAGYTGVLVSLAEACSRLGTGQALFLQALMEAFHCWEPPARQLLLAPLLLYLLPYEACATSNSTPSDGDTRREISLPGSVLLQNLLNFHKPIKVVKSLLDMPLAELQAVACDPKGSHVIDAFMKSLYVGERNREKMIQHLKSQYVTLACNKYGSRSLDAIWAVATLNQKYVIAGELAKKENQLSSDMYGKFVARNCGLFHFKHRPQDWKQVQNNCKRPDLFADIL